MDPLPRLPLRNWGKQKAVKSYLAPTLINQNFILLRQVFLERKKKQYHQPSSPSRVENSDSSPYHTISVCKASTQNPGTWLARKLSTHKSPQQETHLWRQKVRFNRQERSQQSQDSARPRDSSLTLDPPACIAAIYKHQNLGQVF